MSSRLDWRGDEVAANVIDAAKFAVNSATSRAEAHAESTVVRRTSRLAGHISSRPATVQNGQVVGFWGVLNDHHLAFYAWWVEVGTSTGLPARPFLRPAFDAVKNQLARDIARRFG